MIQIKKMNTLTFEEKIQLADYLIEEYSEEILNDIGLTLQSSGKISCPCPVHGGDNPTGFTWQPYRKIWACWTHGCHKTYGSGLIGLVQGVYRYKSVEDAADHIINMFKSKIDENIDFYQLSIKKFIKEKKGKGETVETNLQVPFTADVPIEYLFKRGFDQGTINKFECYVCRDGSHPLVGRVCAPIKQNNKTVGIIGRILDDNLIDDRFNPKWKLFPQEIPKEKFLYGIDDAKKYIQDTGICIIEEGLFDYWKLYNNGIRNHCALMGVNLSKDHIKTLMSCKTKILIPLLDPDKAGFDAISKIKTQVLPYFKVDDYLQNQITKDPGKMTGEEINNVIKSYLENKYKLTFN